MKPGATQFTVIPRGAISCASDLLNVAGQVRRGVAARFQVQLHPEPEFVGFDRPVEELL